MKTIVYDYLFNYFGGEKFEDRIVTGASVQVAIRPYKNGEEVKFENEKELSANGKYLNSVFDVSFDRKNIFNIKRNLYVDNLFRLVYDFDEIKYEVMGFSIDTAVGLTKDVMPELAAKLPEEFKGMPVSESTQVSEKVFRDFILNHLDDFDISDNKKAQCPSVAFV